MIMKQCRDVKNNVKFAKRKTDICDMTFNVKSCLICT